MQDSIDCIDFSCNEISRLENFPVMRRVGTLLLGNNQISRISSTLQAALPTLHTAVLTNNRIASFAEVDALATVSSLRRLSLMGNPVARRPQFRSYVIFRMPHLVELDFEKVRKRERIAAVKWAASAGGRAFLRELDAQRSAAHPELISLPSLIGVQPVGSAMSSGSGPAAAAAAAGHGPASSAAPATGGAGSSGFTAEERAAIAAALQAASTADEVTAIEKSLKAGKLPAAASALLKSEAGSGASAASEAARVVAEAAPVPLGLTYGGDR